MSSPAQADRNLLGGVLALQMDFVTGGQLLAAMNAWTLRKDTPLLDLLRQDGILSGDDHEALSRLVERHLARHDGDAQKSLAAVRLGPEDRRHLEQVTDSEIQTSVSGIRLATPPVGDTPSVVGGPTSMDYMAAVTRGIRTKWFSDSLKKLLKAGPRLSKLIWSYLTPCG